MSTIGERFGDPFTYARALIRGIDDRTASILTDAIVANWEEIKDKVTSMEE